MTNQESMCWVSNDPNNNDHVYHTNWSCHYRRRIYRENLERITICEAQSRGMAPCSYCESR